MAARVAGLYEAAVPIAAQDAGLRAAAVRQALRAVVTKVSGQSALPAYFNNEQLNAEYLVEQFGYETQDEADGRRLYLRVRLNQQRVDQLIRDHGMRVWPEERPLTLLWLAVADADGRRVLGEDSPHAALALARAEAARRGLPLVLPLMDLTESALVPFAVIAEGRAEAIARASEKYAGQHIFIGVIRQQGEQWQGRWHVLGQPEPPLIAPPGSLEHVVASGIYPLVTRVGRQFSGIYSDSPQYHEMVIDDINAAADYARSLQYLRSLSPGEHVDVVGIDQDGIHFRLHTRADIASVLHVIGIDRVLFARDSVDRLVFGLNPR